MALLSRQQESDNWNSILSFELDSQDTRAIIATKKQRPVNQNVFKNRPFASAASALSDKLVTNKSVSACPSSPPPAPKVDTKPASDVIAGAVARAASQSTIHPLDTLKVQMQSGKGRPTKPVLSKIGQLVPPHGGVKGGVHGAQVAGKAMKRSLPKIAGLYRGVFGAASGAGIAIGAYFAFYGAATNVMARRTDLEPAQIAFFAGGFAAAGGSVVKVPLAVCIRSVQAGVYPNVIRAAQDITKAVGVRGLFTGYLPTLMEDVPDMAFKFAAYETLRKMHGQLTNRTADPKEDFAMGAASGAFAAAATTPLDVIKTTMMCSAASRPNMMSASKQVWAQGGPAYFFRGVGARALSNGINSAVFFCFFEALRTSFKKRKEQILQSQKDAMQQSMGNGAAKPAKAHAQKLKVADEIDFAMEPASAGLSHSFESIKVHA